MKLRSTRKNSLTLSILVLTLCTFTPGSDIQAQCTVGVNGGKVSHDNSVKIDSNTTDYTLGTAPDVASRPRVNGMRANSFLGGAWLYASDRNVKENFSPVDADEVLAKVLTLPITEWNYIDEEDKITHIGPMAQDFYQAFGLGGDDKSISTMDPAGVALVSIKALARKQRELEALEGEVDALRRMVRELGVEMRGLKETKNPVSGK